jgi:hypothetical protein
MSRFAPWNLQRRHPPVPLTHNPSRSAHDRSTREGKNNVQHLGHGRKHLNLKTFFLQRQSIHQPYRYGYGVHPCFRALT